MILRLTGKMLRAYECFPEKETLKILGFKWNSREACWEIKKTPTNILEVHKAFNSKKIHLDIACREYLQKAQLDLRDREIFLEEIDSYRKSLFAMKEVPTDGFVFSNGYKPFRHQAIALNFFYKYPMGNLYGDCGVGKTAIMLWLMERLIRERKVSKVLVVCPLAVMRGAWEEDCQKITSNLSLCVLDRGASVNLKILTKDFDKHPKLKKLYDRPFDIYTVTYESMRPLQQYLPMLGFDMIVFDEASKLKSHTAKVSTAAVKLASSFPRKYILSGTPAPNHETEYFSQMRILDEELLGTSFARFRDYYFNPVGFMGWKYELDPMREDEFIKTIYTYGLRFRQKDCIDLPPIQNKYLYAYMDTNLSSTYTTLLKKKIVDLGQRKIPVENPLTESIKLSQLTSGYYRDEEGIVFDFKNPKIPVLKELLDSIPDKQVIIWAYFRKDIEDIAEALGDKCRMLYGGTSSKVDEYSKEFKSGKVQYLVCNWKTVGHGLTWTHANINVYFSMNYSNECYYQSFKRTHRATQKETVVNYHILSKTKSGKNAVDTLICEANQGKIARAEDIMDKFLGLLD